MFSIKLKFIWILEKRIGKKINNYKVFNLAVSNLNGKQSFYISKNPTVSSLNKFRKTKENYYNWYCRYFICL